jgi:hypothetical protein
VPSSKGRAPLRAISVWASFDFDFEWHLTDPDPDPEVDTFQGTLVILQGYDEFEGLHGVLELWGRTGPGGVVAYEGRVHVDPQP